MNSFWLTYLDGWGKEVTGFFVGIKRDNHIIRLLRPNGYWEDTGHTLTEEQAIESYNKIVGELKPINIVY